MKATDKELLIAVAALSGIKGYPPTMQEVAEAVGFKSKCSIHTRLRSLRDRGMLDYEDGSPRTFVLTERGYRCCMKGEQG